MNDKFYDIKILYNTLTTYHICFLQSQTYKLISSVLSKQSCSLNGDAQL